MAIEVELPDGSIVEFPDGTDNGTMERALAQYRAAPVADFSGVQGGSSGQQPFRYPEGATLEQINAQNEAYRSSPQKVEDDRRQEAWQAQERKRRFGELPAVAQAGIGAGSRVGNLAMGVGQLLGLTNEADAAALRENDRFMEGSGAASVGKIGGDLALAAAPGGAASRFAGAGTRIGTNAAVGAGFGALNPTVSGESRAVNAAIGGALGGAGELAGAALRAGAKRVSEALSPAAKELFEAAKARGIALTPAQLADTGLVKRLGERLRDLPLTGAASRAGEQREAWNAALARTIGENAEAVTPEVYARAKARQSQIFDDLTGRNNLKVTDRLFTQLNNIAKGASIAGKDISGQVESAIDALFQQATTSAKGVTIPGRAYQAFDSELGSLMKGGGSISHYLGQVQKAVRNAMDESISPEDAAAWKAVRAEYKNRKTITPLVAKGDGSDITPSALSARVNATKSGKEAMASGQAGELGALARLGQLIREQPALQSGDPLNPVRWPFMAAGALVGGTVGRAAHSPLAARYLASPGAGNALSRLAAIPAPTSIAATPALVAFLASLRERGE